MKEKIKYIIALLLVVGCVYADIPDWTRAELRNTLYRSSEFYSGFAVTDIRKGESFEESLRRAREQARIELVSSIRMSIQVESRNELVNRVYGVDQVQTHETYSSSSVQKSGVENIPGVNVEEYVDSKAKVAYAFAYVEKRGLGRKLEKQLMATISKIEIKLDDAKQQFDNGNKSESRKMVSSLAELYRVVEETQATMLAVDATMTSEDIMQEEYAALRKKASALNAELSDGYAICIKGQALLFESTYPMLINSIKGELSKLGCYFVEAEGVADLVVQIDARAEEYNRVNYDATSAYFTNVIANIKMDKVATGKRVWEDELTQKGSHTMNYKEAAKDGYKQIVPQLAQQIINQLK